MGIRAERKAKTKARIVREASRLFQIRPGRRRRRSGDGSCGEDARRSTRTSKQDDPFAQALEDGLKESRELLLGLPDAQRGWATKATKRYLAPQVVDHPEKGCPAPHLVGDIARSAPKVRRAFTRGVNELIGTVAERLGGGASGEARAKAIFASWVGAIALARALEDKDLASPSAAVERTVGDPRSAERKLVERRGCEPAPPPATGARRRLRPDCRGSADVVSGPRRRRERPVLRRSELGVFTSASAATARRCSTTPSTSSRTPSSSG